MVSVGKAAAVAANSVSMIGLGAGMGLFYAGGTAALCAASFGLGCGVLAGIAVAGAVLGPGGGLEALAGCPKPDDPNAANISEILKAQAEIKEKLSDMGKQLDDLGLAAGFTDIGNKELVLERTVRCSQTVRFFVMFEVRFWAKM